MHLCLAHIVNTQHVLGTIDIVLTASKDFFKGKYVAPVLRRLTV